MDRLSLEPGHWYAAEFLGEEFGADIRSYSPIRVQVITPKGGRRFSLGFYHANYPEGVRDKVYELETIERNTTFILARSASHRPARLMLIYTITSAWLKEHFGIALSDSEDPQAWLTCKQLGRPEAERIHVLTFPFGMPITPVRQPDTIPKRIFVLGVYASAVHARWIVENGKTIINALAVASEPEIFWRGNDVDALIERIPVPPGAGRLVAASKTLNGPSGVTLDSMFLEPLGITRRDAWLCDLLPESRCNPGQRAAIEREYDPRRETLGLPAHNFPAVPSVLASETRRLEIEGEILAALPEVLVTLGDQPLKWFARHYGSHSSLSKYGETPEAYGRLHDLEIAGHALKLLPLVHPRQAGRLGGHSATWSNLHVHWAARVAPHLLAST